MRVLVIEKESSAAARIHEALRQIWCDVDNWEEDGWIEENGEFQRLRQGGYDAVILGSGIPGISGMEILGRLRRDNCQLPVLMVTGGLAEERIDGLEQGADYCLSAPFEERELLAALKAVLRRKREMIPERMNYEELSLDQGTFVLSGPGGSFQLGKREFDVMQTLLVNRDMVVPKGLLLSRIWGDNPEAVENNVEVYISFLRKKLRTVQAGVSILTIRNLGYRLSADKNES